MPARSRGRDHYRAVLRRVAHSAAVNARTDAPFLASRVSFQALADHLGVTRPALYRLWDDQYEFWVDLVRHLAYEHDFSQATDDMPWRAATTRPPPTTTTDDRSPDQLLADRINPVQDVVFDDLRVLIRAASLGYADLADVGTVRREVESSRLRQLAADIDSWLAARDRVVQAPHSALDVAAMAWCVSDGLSVLNHYLPDHCGVLARVDFGSGHADWTLLALTSRALRVGMSKPGTRRPGNHGVTGPVTVRGPELVWTPAQQEALQAATGLFIDSIVEPSEPNSDPRLLEHLTMARVARAAHVSRRTIYNVWPSRAHMLEDLQADLVAERHRLIAAAIATHRTWDGGLDIARATGHLVGPPHLDPPSDPGLAFLIEPGHERFRGLWQTAFLGTIDLLRDGLESYLDVTRRRPRPGITTDHIALIWGCLIAGGRRLRRTGASSTGAFGDAAEALAHELTVSDQ